MSFQERFLLKMDSNLKENQDFQKIVEQLWLDNKGKRILKFEFEGKYFWLKQPEPLTGIWKLLKPSEEILFKKEIDYFQYLMDKGAAVPKLICSREDYYVSEDFGIAVNQYISAPERTEEEQISALKDCVDGLIQLHQQNLTHGRPAIRDILWEKCGVKFIDFEECSTKSLSYLKMRDIVVFIHSLFRCDKLSVEQIKVVIDYVKTNCELQVWQNLVGFLQKYRWVYWLLLPFKPIARVDLIAIYGVFEHIN